MILRNWMEKDPVTTTGDTLVADAIELFKEMNLRAIPVLGNGRLRGLLTRKDLQGCAAAVARAQDPHETDYFLKRLKVKDIMIRMPKTMKTTDTVEYCMLMGQQDLVRNYPVMEKGKLKGMVSSYELFEALSQVLGAGEIWCGITLEPVIIERGTITMVSRVVEDAGGTLFGVFTMRQGSPAEKRIILRMASGDVGGVAAALEENGFKVMEVTQEVQGCSTQKGVGGK